jgi:hypothetical protein
LAVHGGLLKGLKHDTLRVIREFNPTPEDLSWRDYVV